MKVKKAIIPAAGLGTRVLPASKAIPKEMLNVVDKPAIQYLVEEAAAAGIEDILIITNRGKSIIEDHFDHSFELEENLRRAQKDAMLEALQEIPKLANIFYVRQKVTKGLGHAVLCARSFVGNEPFAVMYGDDVTVSPDPVVGQLTRVYEEYEKGVVGVKLVAPEVIHKYSTLKVEPVKNNIMLCTDMAEKPQTPEEVLSLYSILGRCVLPPQIFDILEKTQPGAGGEIQLTDAMKVLARNEGIMAVDFVGTRYDMGDKLGMMKASVEVALEHPEIGAGFREYLKSIMNTL